jgi:hypothetical protein
MDRAFGPRFELAGIMAKREGEGRFIVITIIDRWQAPQDEKVPIHPGRPGVFT